MDPCTPTSPVPPARWLYGTREGYGKTCQRNHPHQWIWGNNRAAKTAYYPVKMVKRAVDIWDSQLRNDTHWTGSELDAIRERTPSKHLPKAH